MKTALIISGGDYAPVDSITYDYCIACDKGAEYAGKMGISPDVIIGDFDSYEGDIKKDYPNTEVLIYPAKKDDTDTMLAIKLALKRGYKHIIIENALGARLDHTVANIQSLNYIASYGGIGEIVSDTEHMRTITSSEGQIMLKKSTEYFSLFALTDKVSGLCIKGSSYDVDNVVLTNNFPLGLGNSFADETVYISIGSGVLLIIQSLS